MAEKKNYCMVSWRRLPILSWETPSHSADTLLENTFFCLQYAHIKKAPLKLEKLVVRLGKKPYLCHV